MTVLGSTKKAAPWAGAFGRYFLTGEMAGWVIAHLLGPRLVEVRRKSSKKIVWSSYVPSIDTAIALWEKVDCAQPSDFDVQIHTQHSTKSKC
jgi:hypothetical protein